MTDCRVDARRVDNHGSLAIAQEAEVVLDTDLAGRRDTMNPVELLLASLATCSLKGTERVIPMLQFDLRGIEVSLRGVRQDSPPKITSIRYELTVDTDETDARRALLYKNLQKFGTIDNTLAGTTDLSGNIRRKA